EASERRAVRRFTQLLEGAFPNLADSLAGDAHQGANLLEGHRVGALLETVVEMQNLAFARGEVLPEDAVDELAHEVEIGHVFDFGAIDAGEALAQCTRLTIGAIDWSVE